MNCSVCAKLSFDESADESYQHFNGFYLRYIVPEETDTRRHEYSYQAFKSKGYTRLLELLPGDQADPISCTLTGVAIDDCPRYAALSYTWGRPSKGEVISVDGKDFIVTYNLWMALWHLRLPDQSRTLWVDAVCIDQSNLEERSYVVSRMKDIYEQADEIIAWLGPDVENGALALSKVKNIYDEYCKRRDRLESEEAALKDMLIDTSWISSKSSDSSISISNTNQEEQSEDAKLWAMKQLLIGRTWFKRVWIVQEGTVPVRTNFHLCHRVVPVEAIYQVNTLLQRLPPGIVPTGKDSIFRGSDEISKLSAFANKRARFLQNGNHTKEQSIREWALLDIIDILRYHKASDPRDKVYAALGFAKDIPAESPIQVDYSKSIDQVLLDVAVACLHKTSYNLRFLGYAGLYGSRYMPASWVPDWLDPAFLTPFPKHTSYSDTDEQRPLFNACDLENPIWKQQEYSTLKPSVEDRTLTVHGIFVDFIRTTSIVACNPINVAAIEDIWVLPNLHKTYQPTGQTLEEAYLSTLVADIKRHGQETIGRGGAMYWRGKQESPSVGHIDTVDLLNQICVDRRFITTLEQGYIGLVPYWARQGDAIFMLLGGEMLYVARPTLQGTYHYVGEAYLHGLMDGQVTKSFGEGKGVLQQIEFVPVTNAGAHDQGMAGSTQPVAKESVDLGYNIRINKLSHINDVTDSYIHDKPEPPIDEAIHHIAQTAISIAVQNGMPREEAFVTYMLSKIGADMIENILLPPDPVSDTQETCDSNSILAGREFAQRLYIRGSIALEQERTSQIIMGSGSNIIGDRSGAPQILMVEKDENTQPIAEGMGATEEVTIAQKKEEDEEVEGLSRALKGWWGGPNSNEASTTSTSATPQESASSSSRHMKSQRLLHTASGEPLAKEYSWPVKSPGPPVRLMQAQSYGPRNISYKFKSNELQQAFLEECKVYTEQGKTPPVLFGRWVTDHSIRPEVVLTSYGRPGRLWWEDEDGLEVDGPEFPVQSITDPNAS